MLKFEYSSLINANVEKVWHFHEREDVLQILTPPWQPVEVIRREGGLEIGAISEFRLWLGLIPVGWLASHTECKPYELFVDEQVSGPMESWVHYHKFAAENGQTRLTDYIEYQLPGGLPAEFLLNYWVDARLRDMFCYRHEATAREVVKLRSQEIRSWE